MSQRTIHDRLREEYFDFLPAMRQVSRHLETDIRHLLLPIQDKLAHYEQLIVKSRVKDCESALRSLERRQEGNVFDPDKIEQYSILKLEDLVGVRILAFPYARLTEADHRLRESDLLKAWAAKPLHCGKAKVEIPKYYGVVGKINTDVYAEYQVVPMLIGLFWDVEHSAMYKPVGAAKGIDKDPAMRSLRTAVESSLLDFESGFEAFLEPKACG